MRSQWFVLSIIVVTLFGLSSMAHASDRDQGQIFDTGGRLGLETEVWSQSITTGISGQLTEIIIQFHYGVPTQPPVLNLSIFDGGNPVSGSALFSEQLFITSADLDDDNLFTWDLSSAGLHFSVGDVFSFVLQADGVGYNIAGNDPPGYVGGELFKNGMPSTELSDIAFITYVDPGEQELLPDIKANGSDDPIIITTEDALSLTVELVPGNYSGTQADWWLLADTPFGWYHYDYNSGKWIFGFDVTYQGALYQLSSHEIMNRTLPEGFYIFYFGIDGKVNGYVNYGTLNYDSVDVIITP